MNTSALDNILDDSYIPIELSEWEDARAEWEAAKKAIEQAREILSDHRVIDRRIEPWLAANAPAPTSAAIRDSERNP